MANVIIGAGPAGVSAGFNFAQNDVPALILEKDSVIGGLAKTLEFEYEGEKYRTDAGPHRFFSQNPTLYELIAGLLKDDWVVVNRLTRQFIDGKYFNYPVDIVQAISNVSIFKAMKMVIAFAYSTIRQKLVKPKLVTFEDWTVANFGRELAAFNMLNYTEKIWGIPCTKIAASWAGQRIKGMNAFDIVKNLLVKGNQPRSMIDSFYYPKKGIQEIYDAMFSFAENHGSTIVKEITITRILHDRHRIQQLEYEKAGETAMVDTDCLISSMPITDLVALLEPKAPEFVLKRAQSLGYRDQIQVFLIVDKPSVTKDTWLYFPTTPPVFGRMMEPKNWYPTMSPPNRTSLLVEYFVFKGDAWWTMPDDEIIRRTELELEALGFAKRKEILKGWVLRTEKSYPVWDLTYKKRLDVLTNYLGAFENLYLIGRNGRYFYNNQDHSIETGLLAAQSVIDGLKYDLSDIGMEGTYFEKGMLYKKA
jgi:protoporphyrinogen oxidase